MALRAFIIRVKLLEGGTTMTTGDRIRAARRQKNMTQDELALAVGVSKPTINKYESGKK